VDFAGGELCRCAARDRPCTAFILADRKERDVPEQVVARSDHAVQSRLVQTEVGKKRFRIPGSELCDLELDLRAERDRAR
jgi:hypothetical protein